MEHGWNTDEGRSNKVGQRLGLACSLSSVFIRVPSVFHPWLKSGDRPMTTLSRRVLPGLPLSLSYSVFYLSVLVLIPLAACLIKAASLSPAEFWAVVWTERARAAYALTFGAALAAAILNVVL